jgi:transcriptional regulator with XRE-family HTH domain
MTDTTDNDQETVLDLLRDRGLSISEVARRAGLPRPGVSDLLRGKVPGNMRSTWPQIAAALGMTMVELAPFLGRKAGVKGAGGTLAHLRFVRQSGEPAFPYVESPQQGRRLGGRRLPAQLLDLPIKFSLQTMGPGHWAKDLIRYYNVEPTQAALEAKALEILQLAFDDDVILGIDSRPSDYEAWWWFADVPEDCLLTVGTDHEARDEPARKALKARRGAWLAGRDAEGLVDEWPIVPGPGDDDAEVFGDDGS